LKLNFVIDILLHKIEVLDEAIYKVKELVLVSWNLAFLHASQNMHDGRLQEGKLIKDWAWN